MYMCVRTIRCCCHSCMEEYTYTQAGLWLRLCSALLFVYCDISMEYIADTVSLWIYIHPFISTDLNSTNLSSNSTNKTTIWNPFRNSSPSNSSNVLPDLNSTNLSSNSTNSSIIWNPFKKNAFESHKGISLN